MVNPPRSVAALVEELRDYMRQPENYVGYGDPPERHQEALVGIWQKAVELAGSDIGLALSVAVEATRAHQLHGETRPEYHERLDGMPSRALGADGDLNGVDKLQHFFVNAENAFARAAVGEDHASVVGTLTLAGVAWEIKDEVKHWVTGEGDGFSQVDLDANELGVSFGLRLASNQKDHGPAEAAESTPLVPDLTFTVGPADRNYLDAENRAHSLEAGASPITPPGGLTSSDAGGISVGQPDGTADGHQSLPPEDRQSRSPDEAPMMSHPPGDGLTESLGRFGDPGNQRSEAAVAANLPVVLTPDLAEALLPDAVGHGQPDAVPVPMPDGGELAGVVAALGDVGLDLTPPDLGGGMPMDVASADLTPPEFGGAGDPLAPFGPGGAQATAGGVDGAQLAQLDPPGQSTGLDGVIGLPDPVFGDTGMAGPEAGGVATGHAAPDMPATPDLPDGRGPGPHGSG